MSRYAEIDLSRVRTYPVLRRGSLVRKEASLGPVRDPGSFAEFWASLPDLLAARDHLSRFLWPHSVMPTARRPLVAFGEHGIKSLEDLADCATDDLIGWTERKDGQTTKHKGAFSDLDVAADFGRAHPGPDGQDAGLVQALVELADAAQLAREADFSNSGHVGGQG